LWAAVAFQSIGRTVHRPTPSALGLLAHYVENLYLAGFVPLQLYTSLVHERAFGGTLAFLPLLMTSTYCAVGIVWSWLRLTVHYVAT
jgi:alpha-1,3-glucosyltransferase